MLLYAVEAKILIKAGTILCHSHQLKKLQHLWRSVVRNKDAYQANVIIIKHKKLLTHFWATVQCPTTNICRLVSAYTAVHIQQRFEATFWRCAVAGTHSKIYDHNICEE